MIDNNIIMKKEVNILWAISFSVLLGVTLINIKKIK
jgi:hypothetical protein